MDRAAGERPAAGRDSAERTGPIAGVILAAGFSRRFAGPLAADKLPSDTLSADPLAADKLLSDQLAADQLPDNKLLAPVDGVPMLRRVAEAAAAAGLAPLLAVLPPPAEAAPLYDLLAGLPVVPVANPHRAEGLASSVRAGVAALAALPGPASSGPEPAGALFLPADQPHLTAAVIARLVAAFRRGGGDIVVPSYRGRRGSPVLFGRRWFPALAALTGDVGGRVLVERHPEAVIAVELDSERPLADVDRPEQLGG